MTRSKKNKRPRNQATAENGAVNDAAIVASPKAARTTAGDMASIKIKDEEMTGTTAYSRIDDSDNDDSLVPQDDPEDVIGTKSDDGEGMSDDEEEEGDEQTGGVYRPWDKLADDEELECDPSFYDTLWAFGLGHSCLSIDWTCEPSIPEAKRPPSIHNGPFSMTVVAGTQAETARDNAIFIARLTNVKRTWKEYDTDTSDSEDESEEGMSSKRSKNNIKREFNQKQDASELPVLEHSHISTSFAVNKVAVCPHFNRLVACWGDNKQVSVYDIGPHLERLDNPARLVDSHQAPAYVLRDHTQEGFALEWSRQAPGEFLTGSQDKTIRHVIRSTEDGAWKVGSIFRGHSGAVEAVSWKSDDPNVFASGSADRSVRLWDIRTPQQAVTILPNAHNGDVNSVAFRPFEEPNHLASAGDDGVIYVRDIRFLVEEDAEIFCGKFHKSPVASLEWHPTDNSMFMAVAYDNTISLWSLDVEPGDSQLSKEELVKQYPGIDDYPEQLLFLHAGQKDLVAAKWHPQIDNMVISTGVENLNIWRAENLMLDGYQGSLGE